MRCIPVIDIFAGPGGLNHGFTAFQGKGIRFEVKLSIEKDNIAHKTLLLRAFLRQFTRIPKAYYKYIRGQISRTDLKRQFAKEWANAEREVENWELGKVPFPMIHSRIKEEIAGSNEWVLLGGPPCQAYSLAGRSRMKGKESFSTDHRHTLYREYLNIVATHQPAIFVMENVKGILSSTYGARDKNNLIIHQILQDLRDPAAAVAEDRIVARFLPAKRHSYKIYSFVTRSLLAKSLIPRDFIISSEQWGVPQKRHRVILLGIRSDIEVAPKTLSDLFNKRRTSIEDVLDGLPRIRSRLSEGHDNSQTWTNAIRRIRRKTILANIGNPGVRANIAKNLRRLKPLRATGARFNRGKFAPKRLVGWIRDTRLGGAIQHESRSHMKSDLLRYFFAACAAQETGTSLKLRDFPKTLLPDHQNVTSGKNSPTNEIGSKQIDFEDRFRVQVKGERASTITSHISKDGHYYIHYDPLQCRSLSVREAARLQTFPDSYLFEGNRTQQYHQVGNAVPPLLAGKLAAVVADAIARSNVASSRTRLKKRGTKTLA